MAIPEKFKTLDSWKLSFDNIIYITSYCSASFVDLSLNFIVYIYIYILYMNMFVMPHLHGFYTGLSPPARDDSMSSCRYEKGSWASIRPAATWAIASWFSLWLDFWKLSWGTMVT